MIGILRHRLHGVRPILLENLDRLAGADAVAVQEDHDFPDGFLLLPARLDFDPPLLAHPGHFLEAGAVLLDHLKDFLPEFLHQLFGIDRADALDQSAGEILLNAFAGVGRGGLDLLRFELPAILRHVDPFPLGLDDFTFVDQRHLAGHGHGFMAAFHFHFEHGIAGILRVEGHPFHRAAELIHPGSYKETADLSRGSCRIKSCLAIAPAAPRIT